MAFPWAFLLTILLPAALGLSVDSKINFEETSAASDQSESESKDVELVLVDSRNLTGMRGRQYIPVILKRSDRKIEARIPVVVEKEAVRVYKGKLAATERGVPIVRGAAVPLRSDSLSLESTRIEGLRPPSQVASDSWLQNQSIDPNSKYPDSNGYYPNVGDGGQTTPSNPKPTYGVPQMGWGCNASPWGTNGGGGYPPPGNRPNQGGNYPGSGEQYPPNHGYPHTPGGYPNAGYPNNQGGYPTNQGGYPSSQGGYPSSQGGHPFNQGGQGGYPSNQGSYPSVQGSYPYPQGGYPSSSGSLWQQPGWGSQTGTGKPWSAKQSGRWVPCEPFDLTEAKGRRRSYSDCPQSTPPIPPATPVSKIDDKTSFNELPKDVEEFSP